MISSPNTMSESSTFTNSMLAFSRPKISRTVSSSSLSSPLPPEPVFFDSLTFCKYRATNIRPQNVSESLARPMFAPTPFNWVRTVSHALLFCLLCHCRRKWRQNYHLILWSLTSWNKSNFNFVVLDNMLNNILKNITEKEGSKAAYIETTAEILNFAYVKNTRSFKWSS